MMRIVSSTIAMAAGRKYSSEATVDQITITRSYDGDKLTSASATATSGKVSQYEVEGSAAVYTTSASGVEMENTYQRNRKREDTEELDSGGQRQQAVRQISLPRAGVGASMASALRCDPKESFLTQMLELIKRLTGKDGGKGDLSHLKGRNAFASASAGYQRTMAMFSNTTVSLGSLSGGGQAAQNGVWTRQVVQSGFVAGEEHTAFTSSGTVLTADGRRLDFNISMEMSRSFESAYMSVGQEAIFTDPLVINMDTDAAAIDDVSFYFDLNCDGEAEEMSALADGSGFLALDRNGDGIINDGSELFGAKTGDGFGELAAFDSDGNGWIDEGDEVFSELSVWVKNGSGEPRLLSLKEADVGAIFLGSQNTQYSLTNGEGDTGAQVRKTGVYLKESGSVGTVQHVDFKA